MVGNKSKKKNGTYYLILCYFFYFYCKKIDIYRVTNNYIIVLKYYY